MKNKLEKCLHPMLEKREYKVFREKIQKEMAKNGLEYLILTAPHNIFYATGYLTLVGSSAAVVTANGDVSLIISTLESADAYASTHEVEVREFLSWVFIDNGSEESRQEKGDIMDPNAVANITWDIIGQKPLQGKIGIELGEIRKHFYDALIARLPEGSVVDGSEIMRNVRVVKTPWEIEMLRLGAQELDKAWKCVAADIKPGMPAWKLDALFAYYANKANLEYGVMGRGHSFIPAAGPYFGLCGMPRGYILKEGDVIKFDVGYKYLGYNSDIARTFAVGGVADDKVQQVYEALYKGNRLGVSMLKPGVRMCDIFHAVRSEVEKCPLLSKYPRGHVGHSVGCGAGAEEYPTLAPNTQYILEPNMVLCLETPYSATGNAPVTGGFNLEDTHVITEEGCDSFTTMPDNIFWR